MRNNCKKNFILSALTILFLVFYVPLAAQGLHSIELMAGAAVSLSSPLTISQNGYNDMQLTADYETRSFKEPIYYGLRINFEIGGSVWELQFIHHKLYLTNTTSEVTQFQVTHGFNIFTLNHRWEFEYFDARLGAGIVLPHSESEVRNNYHTSTGGLLGWGYHIDGPILLAGLGKDFMLTSHFFLRGDAQFTAGWATVQIAAGNADVTNFAFHLIFGIGYKF
jgi:hypothetical protein